MSAKSKLYTRQYVGTCERCGWCCIGRPCGWGVQCDRRHRTRGRCVFLEDAPERPGRFRCGVYRKLLVADPAQAALLAKEMHFGMGCTLPDNPRRLALQRAKETT